LIDCGALTDEDLASLAAVYAGESIPFSKVMAIPNGGLRFGHALTPYATGNSRHPVLIVDDVYTTGRSMNEVLEKVYQQHLQARGVVIFARSAPPDWIIPLFHSRF
jgi:hypothetical protein